MVSSRNPFRVPSPAAAGNFPPYDNSNTVPHRSSIPQTAEERDRKQPFPLPVIALEPPPAYTATPNFLRDDPTFDVSPKRPLQDLRSVRSTAPSHGPALVPSYTGPTSGATYNTTGLTNTRSNPDFFTSSLTTFPLARRRRRHRPGVIHQIAGSLLSSASDSHHRNQSRVVDGDNDINDVPPQPLWPIPGRRNSFDASQMATSSLAPRLQSQPSTSSFSSPDLPRSHRYSPSQSIPSVGPGGIGSPAPAGAPVYSAGDRRVDGVRCWMCGGTGTVSRFMFDRSQCGTCRGIGKWYV